MEAKLKVNLIAYTPDAEKIVASAAKLCYSSVGVEEISKKLDDASTEKFLNMLISLGHESPIEHINFTFAVEGISRACSHQLVRHRIASYSQQSQRYVRLNQFEYVVPPAILENEEALSLFIEAMKKDQGYYDRISAILKEQHKVKLISEGEDEKVAERKAEKMAIEDARYVFPNACETKIVFTMNARTLLHFFNHRCCQRAQWEIREMANEMLKQVKKVAPTIFKYAGPSCVKGACKEGSMTCGKAAEMREKYLQSY